MIRLPLVKEGQIALLVTSIIFAVIPTIAVMLRLIAQALYGGFGWHRKEVTVTFGTDTIKDYHIITLPLEVFWTLSLSLSKISLLLLYIKVFPVSKLTLVCKITCVCVALFAISGVLCTLLICQPIQFNWDQSLPGGHCGNQKAVFGFYGVLNLMTDVLVLTLPIPSLLKLKLPSYKKVALIATFSIGFLTCIASLIRLGFLATVDYADITYSSLPFVLMSAVEPALAVTCACVPLMRPLLGIRGKKYRYSSTGTRQHVGSMSFRNLTGTSASKTISKRKNHRCLSSVTMPAPVLQFEMGMAKEGIEQELMPVTAEYRYEAQVSAGHDSDENNPAREKFDHLEKQLKNRDANIIVTQEWNVEVTHEIKEDI
ncbi:hypothetical protein VMCG_08043 [Cytospora schulzeri]|uniref:Rhodopsin domain-containing protein n=1 Tax=Cytospora schulzeri TaxID=448051 RepID=A0A423VRG6_9PEZI|nr:hypothetical protein VMCG_08043 [Valsa malicola]